MRWLLFLSRLSFICGICFLLTLSIQIFAWTSDQALAGTIITIGVFIGLLVVPVTLLCYLMVMLLKKNLAQFIPIWLIISNVIFLIVLLIYIISLNAHPNPAA